MISQYDQFTSGQVFICSAGSAKGIAPNMNETMKVPRGNRGQHRPRVPYGLVLCANDHYTKCLWSQFHCRTDETRVFSSVEITIDLEALQWVTTRHI